MPALFGPLDNRLVDCRPLAFQSEFRGQRAKILIAARVISRWWTVSVTLAISTWSILFFTWGSFASSSNCFSVSARWVILLSTVLIVCLQRCSCVLLTGEQRQLLQRQIANPRLDYLHRKSLHGKLVALSRKVNHCPSCSYSNGELVRLCFYLMTFAGIVKKTAGYALKIVHAEPTNNIESGEYAQQREFHQTEFPNLIGNFKFIIMDPLRVLNLFHKIKKQAGFIRLKPSSYPVHLGRYLVANGSDRICQTSSRLDNDSGDSPAGLYSSLGCVRNSSRYYGR